MVPSASWRKVREYRLEQPQAGWQVHDPARVLSSIDSALAQCVAGLGEAEVVAISISTAMHGLLALDDHYRPLTSLVTWPTHVLSTRPVSCGNRA